jgi:uncharacterized protein (TIGR02421 family)
MGPADPTPAVRLAERLRALGDRLLAAQRGVRVLEALRWDERVERDFLAHDGRELPRVTADTYRPLPFDPERKDRELAGLQADVRRSLGDRDGLGRLLARRCREFRAVVRLLAARGRPAFARLSRELYGTTLDDGDLVGELQRLMAGWVAPNPPAPFPQREGGAQGQSRGGWVRRPALGPGSPPSLVGKGAGGFGETGFGERLPSPHAASVLAHRLSLYFHREAPILIRLVGGLLADAMADGGALKLRCDAQFSPEDLRLLEVHEGWVHLGTTLNARRQSACAFLSKGPPAATRTQEGLAVLMEFLTGVAHPTRVRRLLLRTRAVALAERGADFREVFRLFRDAGDPPRESFHHTARVFRGSRPDAGPFTKDLCYGQGLLEVWRGVRAALAAGRSAELALLFCGKTVLDELPALAELRDAGLLRAPEYLPPPFTDPGDLAERVALLPALTLPPIATRGPTGLRRRV